MTTVQVSKEAAAKTTTKTNGAKPVKADKAEAKAAAKALFDTYQTAQDAVGAAQMALEKAMADRSGAVAAIKDALGSGPFQWRGKTVSVTSRTSKPASENDAPVTTYFFKGIGGSVQTIE